MKLYIIIIGVQVQCCFTSTETVRTVRDGEPKAATSISTQFLSSERPRVHSCFTSTETVRTVRDGEPKAATSISTPVPELCAGRKKHTPSYVLLSALSVTAFPTETTDCTSVLQPSSENILPRFTCVF